MLCLPQPFANCYILLFSLSKGEKSELLGEKWRLAVWLGSLSISPACLSVHRPDCLWVCLTNSTGCMNAYRTELLSSLWSTDNEPIVVQRYRHTDTGWLAFCFSAPWYSQIHSWNGAGQRRDKDGVRKRRSKEREWRKKVREEWRRHGLKRVVDGKEDDERRRDRWEKNRHNFFTFFSLSLSCVVHCITVALRYGWSVVCQIAKYETWYCKVVTVEHRSIFGIAHLPILEWKRGKIMTICLDNAIILSYGIILQRKPSLFHFNLLKSWRFCLEKNQDTQ